MGTQISWGVRFDTIEQMNKFLSDMAAEVSTRLKSLGMKGKAVHLKVRSLVIVQSFL